MFGIQHRMRFSDLLFNHWDSLIPVHGKESRIGERGNETYIYREYSGDSRPTLEKQVNGRPKIKIRYEE